MKNHNNDNERDDSEEAPPWVARPLDVTKRDRSLVNYENALRSAIAVSKQAEEAEGKKE